MTATTSERVSGYTEALRKRLQDNPDGQIAWVAESFEVLAHHLAGAPEGDFVNVPTSANLLVDRGADHKGTSPFTGKLLGYQVAADRIVGSAFVRGGHSGLVAVDIPKGMAKYWRIGIALTDAIGELHGLVNGGLERIHAPPRDPPAGTGHAAWAARTMLRLCLVRLTGRGQVRRFYKETPDALPTTIRRTLDHMHSWPSTPDGSMAGLRVRVGHLLAMHVAIAAARLRSQGAPPGSEMAGGAVLFLADVGQRSVPYSTSLIKLLGESFPALQRVRNDQMRQPALAWWRLALCFGEAADALREYKSRGNTASLKASLTLEVLLASSGLRILAIAATLRAMALERLALSGDRSALWQRLRVERVRLREVWDGLKLGDEPILLRTQSSESRADRTKDGFFVEAVHPMSPSDQSLYPKPLEELLLLAERATSKGAATAETDLHEITPLGWLVLLAVMEDPVLGRLDTSAIEEREFGDDDVVSDLVAMAHDLAWVPDHESDDWPWLGAQELGEVWTHSRATAHLERLHEVDQARHLHTKRASSRFPPVKRGSAELGEGELRVALPDEGGTTRVQRWQVYIAGLPGEGRDRRPLTKQSADGSERYHWTVTWHQPTDTGRRRLVSITYARPGLALAGAVVEEPDDEQSPPSVEPKSQSVADGVSEEGSPSNTPPHAPEMQSVADTVAETGLPADTPDESPEGDGVKEATPEEARDEPSFPMLGRIEGVQSKSWQERGDAHGRPPGATGGERFSRSRLRVALLQWQVDDSYQHPVSELCLHAPLDGLRNRGVVRKKPSEWSAKVASANLEQIPSCAEARRRAFLDKALEICSHLRVDVLVLPEYSVRPETVEWLECELGRHDCLQAILAGTYRVPTSPQPAGSPGPGSAMLTLLRRRRSGQGEGVEKLQRPKVYAAEALGELIRPTDRDLSPLYVPSARVRDDLLGYVCELVCAENFAATSPANLPSLADDVFRRYQRFGLRPATNPKDTHDRVLTTLGALGRELSPDNLLRRSIVLVPAMTTRTVDYALLGQTSFLAAGITTVLCSAAVHGWKHSGGSCFIGHDCWNIGANGPPGMPRPGPYHGAQPGIWRQAPDNGALGSEEQALLVADIDPIHGADRKPRGQGQTGSPLELVAHIPFIELPPFRPPRPYSSSPPPPCRCSVAAKASGTVRERVRKMTEQMARLLDNQDAPMATNTISPSVVDGVCKALDTLETLLPKHGIKKRLHAFREHHATSLQPWPPPALLDWAVVDPWKGTGSVPIKAPPFALLSGDDLAELLSNKGTDK